MFLENKEYDSNIYLDYGVLKSKEQGGDSQSKRFLQLSQNEISCVLIHNIDPHKSLNICQVSVKLKQQFVLTDSLLGLFVSWAFFVCQRNNNQI